MMNKQQLEISLKASPCGGRRAARPVRPARAQWWFERMHRVVDAAIEWKAEPKPPVRQALLPLVLEREAA
jgi:hypothetical protein